MVTDLFLRYWFCRQKLILRTKRKIQVNHLFIPGNLASDYNSNNDESPPLNFFMGYQESKVWLAYAIINEEKEELQFRYKNVKESSKGDLFLQGIE